MVDARTITKPPFKLFLNGSGQIAMARSGSIMKINMKNKSLEVVEDTVAESNLLASSSKLTKEVYGIFGQI